MTPAWLEDPFLPALGLVLLAVVLLAAWLTRLGARRTGDGLVRDALLSQLGLAVERGLPLEEALLALGQDLERRGAGGPLGPVAGFLTFTQAWAERRHLRAAAATIFDVAAELRDGGPLGRALARAGDGVVPPADRKALDAAAAQGGLGPALRGLRALSSEGARLRETLRGSLVYPSIVLGIVLAGAWFIAVVVGPKMAELTDALSATGSRRTVELLGGVHQLLSLAAPLLAVVLWIGASGALAMRLTWPERLASWLLPPVRRVREAVERGRRARLLAALLRAGVPLPDALRAAAPVLPSPEAAVRAAGRAAEGAPADEALVLAGALRAGGPGGDPAGRLEAAGRTAEADAAATIAAAGRVTLPAMLAIAAGIVVTSWWPYILHMSLLKEVYAPW